MQTMIRRPAVTLCLGAAALILFGQAAMSVSGQNEHAPGAMMMSAGPTKAVCVVQSLGGSKVEGKVTFTKESGGVMVMAELSGLTPGKHGFHVHEFGDCSMMDGTCAGGHFNPENTPHGGPDSAERHVGDLGNIEADSSGNAVYKKVDKLISLSGSHSIIGRSIIVHAGTDDLTTQPSGDAGARVGCGVIGIADPKMADHQ